MKPDWKDAPEWANWLAQDGNGEWWWYEDEPRVDSGDGDVWVCRTGRRKRFAPADDWESTLEPRHG